MLEFFCYFSFFLCSTYHTCIGVVNSHIKKLGRDTPGNISAELDIYNRLIAGAVMNNYYLTIKTSNTKHNDRKKGETTINITI